ncbi:MAG: hypothetical protein QOI57_3407 [Rubrobacteraceae bacterium]|jgi:uncharacterized RDD family membrane protein YckC|nr:hypothetical protein [Rubrobacteraceae bacterium]
MAAEGAVAPAVAPREDIHVTGRRVLAIIIDGILLGLVFGLMSFLFGTASTGEGGANASLNGVAALVYFLIAFAYFTILEGYLGQTVGKMLLGIKVVREDNGEVPGIGAAAIRTLLRIIDGLFFYLVGFIAVMASAKRQRLGDMAAHTLVVRK